MTDSGAGGPSGHTCAVLVFPPTAPRSDRDDAALIGEPRWKVLGLSGTIRGMFGKTQLQEAFKLALSMTLMYWLAMAMNWDLPKYGGLAIVLVSLGTTGASLQKGLLRVVGTTAGLLVGLFAVAAFSQDQWLMLAFQVSYLLTIGYFMQGSRYAYAWCVAGFLAPLVWASSYGDAGSAFHFATFRYLETSAGVVIYTIVSAVLWPRRAGDQLDQLGEELWTGLRRLYGLYRGDLEEGLKSDEAPKLRTQLVGTGAKLGGVISAAYADTPSVIEQRRTWEQLRVDIRVFADSLELWRQTIEDCRPLHLDRLLPDLAPAMENLDRRLARIAELWQARQSEGDRNSSDDGDARLVEPLTLTVNEKEARDLSQFERAALLSFVEQWSLNESTGSRLLDDLRVLAGLQPLQLEEARRWPRNPYRPSRWDPERLASAAYPSVCFVVAYLFWIFTDVPTGPKLPATMASISIALVLTPMDPKQVLFVVIASLGVAVAPVYLFVMPWLDTGLELLGLIFSYTFLFGCLGGISPMLRLGPIAMFVLTTGISNDQRYSLLGLTSAAVMLIVVMGIAAAVSLLWTTERPEKQLLRGVRRFSSGCQRILATLAPAPAPAPAPAQERRNSETRRLHIQRILQIATKALPAAAGKLDATLFPDNDAEKVQQLVSSFEAIASRIVALAVAHDRLAGHARSSEQRIAALGAPLLERLQGVFASWMRYESAPALSEDPVLQRLAAEFESELGAMVGSGAEAWSNDETLTETFAVIGTARGLVDAMTEGQHAISRINWAQWAEARF